MHPPIIYLLLLQRIYALYIVGKVSASDIHVSSTIIMKLINYSCTGPSMIQYLKNKKLEYVAMHIFQSQSYISLVLAMQMIVIMQVWINLTKLLVHECTLLSSEENKILYYRPIFKERCAKSAQIKAMVHLIQILFNHRLFFLYLHEHFIPFERPETLIT